MDMTPHYNKLMQKFKKIVAHLLVSFMTDQKSYPAVQYIEFALYHDFNVIRRTLKFNSSFSSLCSAQILLRV